MDKLRHAKEQVSKTKESNFVSGGREWAVYRKATDDVVHKVAQEQVSKQGLVTRIDESGYISMVTYNIEDVPSHMRRFLISQHILGKILHVLYPDNVPDRFSLKTKAHPRFSQDFIEGGGIGTKIEYKRRESTQPVIDNSRFKIKESSEYMTEPTEAGQEILDTWERKVDNFIELVAGFGIGVDINNKEANFVVDRDGNNMYVDSFDFTDANLVADSLSNEIISREEGGKISSKRASAVRVWIERFQSLNV